MSSELLTTPQAADYLGLSRRTLEGWRVHGGGPVFVKLGRRVAYLRADLEAYLEAHRYLSTSDYTERNRREG